jgi:hypothetical protein
LGRRVHPRFAVKAEAALRVDGEEVHWPVGTLSWGGASLVVGATPLPEGTRLRVRFVQPQHDLGTAEVEVVYAAGGRIGLRFLDMSNQLEHSLEALFAELTPIF